MEPFIFASASMPSISSYTTINRRNTVLPSASSHILAYLRKDSMQAVCSDDMKDELGPAQKWHNCFDAKRASLGTVRPCANNRAPLRSLENLDAPSNTSISEAPSASILGPTKRRPPPLKLPSFQPEFDSSIQLISDEKTPVGRTLNPPFAHPSTRISTSCALLPPLTATSKNSPLDPHSPWQLLDNDPFPSLTEIPRSRTSLSLSKILRRGKNIPAEQSSKLRQFEERRDSHDENEPPTPRPPRKRKHTKSNGSLGRALPPFSPISAPSTPLPPPLPRCRSRSNSNNRSERLTYAHKSDTFTSKLFALASPGFDVEIPPSPRLRSHYIPHHEWRLANPPINDANVPASSPGPALSRSKSLSRVAFSKTKQRKKQEPEIEIMSPTLPADFEKLLVLPPRRRARSPSYIDVQVQPRQRMAASPIRSSFKPSGTPRSPPDTPTNEVPEWFGGAMYLPRTNSAESILLDADPFGAGEPASFFRSEFSQRYGETICEGGGFTKHHEIGVPEIVVVSSSVALLRSPVQNVKMD